MFGMGWAKFSQSVRGCGGIRLSPGFQDTGGARGERVVASRLSMVGGERPVIGIPMTWRTMQEIHNSNCGSEGEPMFDEQGRRQIGLMWCPKSRID